MAMKSVTLPGESKASLGTLVKGFDHSSAMPCDAFALSSVLLRCGRLELNQDAACSSNPHPGLVGKRLSYFPGDAGLTLVSVHQTFIGAPSPPAHKYKYGVYKQQC